MLCQKTIGNSATVVDPVSQQTVKKLVVACLNASFYENEQSYTYHMSLVPAKYLSCDHTFKVAMNVGLWIGKKWL